MRFDNLSNKSKIVEGDPEVIRIYTLIAFIIVGLITWGVYYSGGTMKIYPSLMYIPITLAAGIAGKI